MNIKDRLAAIAESPRENGQWAREALDEIVKLDEENKRLHISLAGAVQHAEQGWSRYESANRDRNSLRAAIAQQDKKED